jgi:hypothetical protein
MEVSISDPKLKILWCLTQTVGYFCEKRRKQAVPFFWVEIYIVKFVDVQQDCIFPPHLVGGSNSNPLSNGPPRLFPGETWGKTGRISCKSLCIRRRMWTMKSWISSVFIEDEKALGRDGEFSNETSFFLLGDVPALFLCRRTDAW